MPTVQLTEPSGRLPNLPALARRVEDLGYEAIWIGEVNETDAVVPATLATTSTVSLQVGGLFNVFTRAPTNIALAGAGLARLAPGRIKMVLGASSPLLVERWNGIPYRQPYRRLRDYLCFLRQAFGGDRVSGDFATFRATGFSLADPPEVAPSILVAAAMPRSIALGSTEADGVVLNWTAPEDLDRLTILDGDRARVWLSLHVCPTPDRTEVDRLVRPLMADYLSAPAYAALQRQVGRAPALEATWKRFAAGDREGARAALPGGVIDDLVVWGTPEQCGHTLRGIEATYGVHAMATVHLPDDLGYDEAIGRMSPAGG